MKKALSRSRLYEDIRNIIAAARHKAYKSVNFVMVEAYWNVGRRIVEEEQKGKSRAEYGAYLIRRLSDRLKPELGPGFSEQGLWNMRQFYLTFPILSTVWRELSWSHYRLLMRVESANARRYYAEESVRAGWSVRAMERQISSHYYERLLSSRNKLPVKKEAEMNISKAMSDPRDFIKDPYVLEFLDIKPESSYREKDLERSLISHLQKFLLELGKGFSFVARQQRISTETKGLFIDLVFYNYILKCFVLIDLKVGELTHQDIGQMDMYVRLYEDRIRGQKDNPTIGIILCAEKDETIVKYSVIKDNKKLFASKYKLYLPTEQELIAEMEREKQALLIAAGKQKLKGTRKDIKNL